MAPLEKVIVPEHNYTGQLAGLIEASTHCPVIRLSKVEGLPFHPSELAKKLKSFIEAENYEHQINS